MYVSMHVVHVVLTASQLQALPTFEEARYCSGARSTAMMTSFCFLGELDNGSSRKL